MRNLVTACVLAPLSLIYAQAPKSPLDTPQDAEQGRRLFQTHCSYCHGARGEGGRGPDLTNGQYRYGGSDAELFATIGNGIRGSEMPAARATEIEVWRMVAFVKKIGSSGLDEKARGNAAAGKAIYLGKGKCAVCHTIGMEGGSLGPDLTGIGRRRGLEHLEESIVKPEAEVPISYRAVRVSTKTGQTIVGIRLNEDDLSIQVRDTSDNLRSILKSNIRQIRSDQPSLMPAYGSILNKTEVTDLVAYLSTLRGTQ